MCQLRHSKYTCCMDKMFGYEIKVRLPPSLANEGMKSLVTEDILKKYWRVWIVNKMNLEKFQKQRQICQFK